MGSFDLSKLLNMHATPSALVYFRGAINNDTETATTNGASNNVSHPEVKNLSERNESSENMEFGEENLLSNGH